MNTLKLARRGRERERGRVRISDPHNETMMKMFALVHVGERAGSGIPNMVKNWTDAGYGKPVLSEQVNPERSTIFLPLSQVSAAKKRQKKAAETSMERRRIGKRQSSSI